MQRKGQLWKKGVKLRNWEWRTGAEEIGGGGSGIGLTRLFGCRRASHLQQEIQRERVM